MLYFIFGFLVFAVLVVVPAGLTLLLAPPMSDAYRKVWIGGSIVLGVIGLGLLSTSFWAGLSFMGMAALGFFGRGGIFREVEKGRAEALAEMSEQGPPPDDGSNPPPADNVTPLHRDNKEGK